MLIGNLEEQHESTKTDNLPNVLLPQVQRLLLLKSLSRHLDVVQLGDARRTSHICSSRNNPALYARAGATVARAAGCPSRCHSVWETKAAKIARQRTHVYNALFKNDYCFNCFINCKLPLTTCWSLSFWKDEISHLRLTSENEWLND